MARASRWYLDAARANVAASEAPVVVGVATTALLALARPAAPESWPCDGTYGVGAGETSPDRVRSLGLLIDTSMSMKAQQGKMLESVDSLFRNLQETPDWDVELHVVRFPDDLGRPEVIQVPDDLKAAHQRIRRIITGADYAPHRVSPVQQGLDLLVDEMGCAGDCVHPAVILTLSDLLDYRGEGAPGGGPWNGMPSQCSDRAARDGILPESVWRERATRPLAMVALDVEGEFSRTGCVNRGGRPGWLGAVAKAADLPGEVASALADPGSFSTGGSGRWQREVERPDPQDSVVEVRVAGGSTCTGSVIGERAVLTARHCLPADEVAVGPDPLRPTRRLAVVGSAVPDEIALDVAVLWVADDLRLPALGVSRVAPPVGAGELVFVGYGASGTNLLGAVRRRHTMQLPAASWGCDVRRAAALGCDPARELVIPAISGVDTCQGDSGGPVLAIERSPGEAEGDMCSWRVVATVERGLANAARACGDGGVYARMDVLNSWIVETLERGAP